MSSNVGGLAFALIALITVRVDRWSLIVFDHFDERLQHLILLARAFRHELLDSKVNLALLEIEQKNTPGFPLADFAFHDDPAEAKMAVITAEFVHRGDQPLREAGGEKAAFKRARQLARL